MLRALFRIGILGWSVITYCGSSEAQIANVTSDQAPPIEGVGHDYIKMFNETVSPATGSVSIRIGVPTPTSRGFSVPFAFGYDSNAAFHRTPGWAGTWADNSNTYLAEGGWSYVLPSLTAHVNLVTYSNGGGAPYQCYYMTGLIFTDENGSTHAPPIAPTESGNTGNCVYVSGYWHPGAQYQNGADAKVQGVTTFMKLGVASPFTFANADGLVYQFNTLTGDAINPSGTVGLPTFIEDRNGNRVTFQDNGSGNFKITDTAGRTALSSSGFGVTGNTITVPDAAGTYTVNWAAQSASNMLPNSYETALVSPWPSGYKTCAPGPPNQINFNHITRITLPNGLYYSFTYDSASSLLSRITYPNGAYIRYVWAPNLKSDFGLMTALGDVTGSADCEEQYDTWAIQNRYVSFDGSNEVLEQDYAYSTTWVTCPNSGAVCESPSGTLQQAWTKKQTTVTTTVRTATMQSLGSYQTVYSYTPFAVSATPNSGTWYGGSAVAVESEVDYYDFSGTKLRSVQKTWVDPQLPPNETVILDSGQESQMTYAFSGTANDLHNCNISCISVETDEYHYDWGQGAPGGLLKRVHADYQVFPSTPIYPAHPSISDRTSDVIVYDGSGNRVAETDYAFDGASVAAVSPAATGHDETNYPPAYTNRGNTTSKTVQCIGCTNAVTKYTYDETGQVLTSVDPCGNSTCADMTGANHTTTYSYSDAYTILSGGANVSFTPPQNTNAYLTKITDALSHSSSFTYDFDNGQLTAAKDPNGQTTSYIYNDPFARPTQASYPDGGLTTVAYNDSTPSVTTTKAVTGSVNVESVVIMDGVGHPIQTQLVSDPEGTVYVDTSYNGLGQAYTVSNPYRTTNDPTFGESTYLHDALGRTTSVLRQDSQQATTSYSGNCSTSKDEASKQRKFCSDGLARLTGVWEDPTGLNYETDYSYDALGNLLTVSQKGGSTNSANWRARTFQYDSLSRLKSSGGPELSAAVTYIYDVNGNVSTRTAPLQNQQSSTVVTSYSYDVINRLTAKTYLDTSTNQADPYTPIVRFGYDGATLSGCPAATPPALTDSYGLGRRTSMCDGSGATSWRHDKLGRIIIDDRTIGAASAKTNTYGFNLDGSVASLVTSPLKEIDYSYGGAARALSAVDTGDSINFATSATYAPFGALTGLIYGSTASFAGISLQDSYNTRLQPAEIRAFSPTATLLDLCYDFHSSRVQFGPNCFIQQNVGDNGNVFQVVNNVTSSRSRTFTYDALNRISTGQSSGSAWGETYTIDPWGNLTNIAGITGKTYYEPLNCPADTHNRLSTCFGYDIAGNMIQNGSANFVYDAENRLVWAGGYRYIYDGDGARAEKCAASSATTACPTSGTTGTLYFRGAGSDTLDEADLAGNAIEEYIYFNGQRIARRDIGTNAVHYYFSDHLGSHSVVENATGTTCEQDVDYYPYGGQQNDYCPVVAQHYKFTGKERDTESGNDYFGARYYGSSTGRFMSPDPSGLLAQHPEDPQSWGLYAYARNNPLIYLDPNGLDCIYATNNGKGVESIDHNSNSGECGEHGGTWLSGYVDEDWAHYNKKAKAFEAAGEDDNGQVNFAQFQAGAQTNDSGDCLSGCGSYGFASASGDWLTGQLEGNSRPTDGSDPLDGLLTFMTKRDQPVRDFWKVVAGPLNGRDNWAGPGGMGPPTGTGDWRAAVHDYNLDTNHLTIGSYFNPFLSLPTSRALIQSNGQLMKTGGFQGAKEKGFFGIVNAFQWYADSWK